MYEILRYSIRDPSAALLKGEPMEQWFFPPVDIFLPDPSLLFTRLRRMYRANGKSDAAWFVFITDPRVVLIVWRRLSWWNACRGREINPIQDYDNENIRTADVTTWTADGYDDDIVTPLRCCIMCTCTATASTQYTRRTHTHAIQKWFHPKRSTNTTKKIL